MKHGSGEQPSTGFAGTPSDDVPGIRTCGSPGIQTLFVSMAERHPDGADAQYLRWHTLDHRPEQQRLQSVRTSLRVVSTPACRAARAACEAQFEAVDHVMTYFFTGLAGLDTFNSLSTALRNAGRAPFILTPVQRGVYSVAERVAAPRAKLGSDVLPWMPVRGVYLLIEQGCAPSKHIADIPGVAGVWSAISVETPYSTAGAGQQMTCCFLDDDPVAVAQRLRPLLADRWRTQTVKPLLAAPFYSVVPYEWDRYLP
jgi:hypothetical protein